MGDLLSVDRVAVLEETDAGTTPILPGAATRLRAPI
jgi:hypothetical protein